MKAMGLMLKRAGYIHRQWQHQYQVRAQSREEQRVKIRNVRIADTRRALVMSIIQTVTLPTAAWAWAPPSLKFTLRSFWQQEMTWRLRGSDTAAVNTEP